MDRIFVPGSKAQQKDSSSNFTTDVNAIGRSSETNHSLATNVINQLELLMTAENTNDYIFDPERDCKQLNQIGE